MSELSERQTKILNIIKSSHHVKVRALSEQLSVSQETIRRDFDYLEQLGYLVRRHGSASYKAPVLPKLGLEERASRCALEKEAIAEVAASLINDGEVIMVVSSSTTAHLGPWLKEKDHLILLTNNIQLGVEVGENPSNHVIFLGGEYKPGEYGIWGDETVETMARFHPDKAFFSITGLSLRDGISSYVAGERNLIRKVVEMSRESYVMADNTKFGALGVYYTCKVSDVSAVITDWRIPQKMFEEFRTEGVKVFVAQQWNSGRRHM